MTLHEVFLIRLTVEDSSDRPGLFGTNTLAAMSSCFDED